MIGNLIIVFAMILFNGRGKISFQGISIKGNMPLENNRYKYIAAIPVAESISLSPARVKKMMISN